MNPSVERSDILLENRTKKKGLTYLSFYWVPGSHLLRTIVVSIFPLLGSLAKEIDGFWDQELSLENQEDFGKLLLIRKDIIECISCTTSEIKVLYILKFQTKKHFLSSPSSLVAILSHLTWQHFRKGLTFKMFGSKSEKKSSTKLLKSGAN